jgi:signal transduction histidine kinase
MARLAAPVYREAMRSFLAEPRPWNAPPPGWRDWVLVAAVLAAGVVEVIIRDQAVWPLLPVVLLPWRRTHPVLVIAVTFGLLLPVDSALFSGTYVLLLPYALFRWGSGREAVIGMAILIPVHALSLVITGDAGDVAAAPFFLAFPAALGAAVRYRVSARAREAEEIRLREREQLARELHDTVAHHVSAIVIRAQAGRAQPGAAVDALEVIAQQASRTLAELRALVGNLRPDLAPQRGVADIARLAESNTRVDVRLDGDLDGLRPLVGAAIYRIAQESITNAIRHARRATRIDVRVSGEPDCVRLTVRDDGDAATPGAPGFGLVGMTERAAMLGGTLDARANADSGWTVTAVLPR